MNFENHPVVGAMVLAFICLGFLRIVASAVGVTLRRRREELETDLPRGFRVTDREQRR